MEINESREHFYGLKEEDIKLFVGNKHEYYLEKWKNSSNAETKRSWNWMSFLGGLFWFGYRKMYTVVYSILGIYLLLDILGYIINIDLSKTGTGISVISGLLGNNLYYKHVKKKINHIYTNTYSNRDIQKNIKDSGGTSWKGVIYVVVLVILYVIIATLLEIFLKENI